MSEELRPLSPEEGIDRFLRHREPSVRDSTLYNAQTRLRFFNDWCEEVGIENLNDLDGRELADFVAWRRGDISPITLQKQLSTIRQALDYWADIEAVEEGLREKVHAPELPDGAESRDDHLSSERAESILSTLYEWHYASPRHVMMELLWRTGMRRSALRSLDVDDLQPGDYALQVEHRPDQGTKLKNGAAGERWIYLGPRLYQIVDDSLDHPDRYDVVDEYGRKPLLTTSRGRPTGDTLYTRVNRATQPCEYGECPHDREMSTCEARGTDGYASKCPSACGPHAIRRGSITHYLKHGTHPSIVSERMDVSPEIIEKHYDVRTERERMNVRRDEIPEETFE